MRRALRLSHHHSSRLATTVIATCICTYLECECVRRVRRSHHHQCTRGETVIPYVHIIGVHDFLHGYFYAHYCTHTRTYGGVGFRNENVSQVEILPQLFHPHTYVTPTPLHTTSPIHHSTPTPNPSKPLILPHSHYILTTFLPTHAYSPIHTHII